MTPALTETDAQLLEAAAKAAGLDYGVIHQRPHRRCPEGWTPWNPLSDDGDALRLAVALRLTVAVRYNECEVFADGGPCLASEPIFTASAFVKPEHATDPAEATRRAIVRAAA